MHGQILFNLVKRRILQVMNKLFLSSNIFFKQPNFSSAEPQIFEYRSNLASNPTIGPQKY